MKKDDNKKHSESTNLHRVSFGVCETVLLGVK